MGVHLFFSSIPGPVVSACMVRRIRDVVTGHCGLLPTVPPYSVHSYSFERLFFGTDSLNLSASAGEQRVG